MDGIRIKDIVGMTYDKGKMYITPTYIPVIVVYDFSTKKTEKLCDYPKEMMSQFSAFEKIIKCGSKIYLFPCMSDKIYCYDICTEKYKELLALDSIEKNLPKRKCFDVLKHEQYIYAVCINPNFVMRINPLNDDMQVWKPDYKAFDYDDTVNYPFSACIYDDKLIYPYSLSLKIEFCMNDETFRFADLTGREKNYSKKEYGYLQEFVWDSAGKFWVSSWYGELFRIDDNEMKKIEMPLGLEGVYDDGVSKEVPRINKIILNSDKLYFVLQCDRRILGYDIVLNDFFWVEDSAPVWKEERRKLFYSAYSQMEEDSFLLFNYNEMKIYVWNIEKGFTDEIELYISLDAIVENDYLCECWEKNLVNQDDLETYLLYIKRLGNNKLEKKESNNGEAIYSALLK